MMQLDDATVDEIMQTMDEASEAMSKRGIKTHEEMAEEDEVAAYPWEVRSTPGLVVIYHTLPS